MKIIENIYRIVIPFEDIYTTVFLICTESGAMLFDTATYPDDMDQYVFPMLEALKRELKCVFISHNHRDHAGGLSRVIEKYPEAMIFTGSEAIKNKFQNVIVPQNGDVLMDCLRAVSIPGHTADAMGLLDTRTGTLLTGDCLQLYGIFGSGKWGANITFPAEHIAAIKKLRTMNLETIIASHDYHPCGFMAQGKTQIERYLGECVAALENIRDMVRNYPELNDAQIAEIYNREEQFPTLSDRVVTAVRKALACTISYKDL